jgi:hypothetical protein
MSTVASSSMGNPPKRQKKIHNHACTAICDNGETCQRKFTSPFCLRAHQRFIHLKIFDHVCVHLVDNGGAKAVLCNKSFEQKNRLVQHVKHAHSKLKPFACDFKNTDNTTCGYLCKCPQQLDSHKQRHLDIKKYKCSLCPESFGQLGNFRHHDNTVHKGIFVKIKCPDCKKEYISRNTLAIHNLFQHADQTCPNVMARIEKIKKCKREIHTRRYANDRVYRLKHNMSGAIRAWLRCGGKKKGCKSSKLLMMSAADTIKYLEKSSVSGLKYGDPDVQVDHIKPRAAFKRLDDVEQRECWCYLNLQLLTAKENNAKSDKFDQAAYDKLDIGKEIAVLRVGWVEEFGESNGPEIIFDENDVGPSNAEGDGAVYDEAMSSDSDDDYSIDDEDGDES